MHPQPGEVEAWSWVQPAAALADNEFNMVFATRRVLEMVAVEEAVESLFGRYRALKRVRVVRPVVEVKDGRFEVVTGTMPAVPRARVRRSR